MDAVDVDTLNHLVDVVIWRKTRVDMLLNVLGQVVQVIEAHVHRASKCVGILPL